MPIHRRRKHKYHPVFNTPTYSHLLLLLAQRIPSTISAHSSSASTLHGVQFSFTKIKNSKTTQQTTQKHLHATLTSNPTATTTTTTPAPTMAPKEYKGSCHCALITFTCNIDFSSTPTSKCNCSICSCTRAWEFTLAPSAFTLNPASEAHLTDYRFGDKVVEHLFCKVCGVRAFGRGEWKQLGEFVSVNVVCLEGIMDEELVGLDVIYRNGREDAWGERPVVTGHL